MATRSAGIFDAARSHAAADTRRRRGKVGERISAARTSSTAPGPVAVRGSAGRKCSRSFSTRSRVHCECVDRGLAPDSRERARGGGRQSSRSGWWKARFWRRCWRACGRISRSWPIRSWRQCRRLRDYVIAVDPFGGAARANWQSLRAGRRLAESRRHADDVSRRAKSRRFSFRHCQIADPAWNENVDAADPDDRRGFAAGLLSWNQRAGFQMAGLDPSRPPNRAAAAGTAQQTRPDDSGFDRPADSRRSG